jgi:hypothetical protein
MNAPSDLAQTLARRAEAFPRFLEERMPVLTDFAEALGLPSPAMIVADPASYLPTISNFLRNQVVGEDDRVWVHTRLGYLIGKVLVQRLAGRWFLCQEPSSPHFLRYVVGSFQAVVSPSASVDPFEAADRFLSLPPGRDLVDWVAGVEATAIGRGST